MSDGWDTAEALADKHGGGGVFVRLANNGDKVVGAFVGEPYARETHWGEERSVECSGASCRLCAEKQRPSLRVSMNFYVPAERDLKIIEGGVTWFKDLRKLRNKYGFDTRLFEIERHGAAGDKKTSYTILPEGEDSLTPALKQDISRLALHDLPKVLSGGSDNFESYDKSNGKRSNTIDPRTASQFMSQLKALPSTAVTTFVERFGVQRIRDVKAADEEAARSFIEALEANYASPDTTASAEVDPFA